MLPDNYVLPIMQSQGIKHAVYGYGMIVTAGNDREKAKNVPVRFKNSIVVCAVDELEPARMPAAELYRLRLKHGYITEDEDVQAA